MLDIAKNVLQKWRKNQEFPRKTKVDVVITTRPALQEMLMGVLQAEMNGLSLVTWK